MQRSNTDSDYNPNSVMALAARDDVEYSPEDRFIAVMGMTGSGKSTFISHLTNGDARVGHDLSSLYSGTTDMESFPFDMDGRKIHLIDTPGFDDTYRTDSEVLKEIAFWLRQTYKKNVKLSGIVYLHPITNTRITGSVHKNLRLFERLCGDETLKTVVLATTMWNQEDAHKFEKRQEQLKTNQNFWGDMVSRGSAVFRHNNNRQSAVDIVTYILDQNMNTVLQIQREMVDGKKTLDETSAGQMLGQDLDNKRQRIESRLRENERELDQALEEGDPKTIDMATGDQDRLKRQLEEAIRDREALKITNDKLLEIKEAEYQAQRAKQLAEAEEKQQQLEHMRLTNDRYRKEIDTMSLLLPDKPESSTPPLEPRKSSRTLFRHSAVTSAGSVIGKSAAGAVVGGAAGLAAISCTVM
ncbi:hypothetical protein MRS44_013818 [Fusarium solani]|uniref:uncharacterized protein n=1 Tax=Fusarium solani TaxID=169388 RepID=UPI0032C45274|nr:hypothetical protein MRS44_013818 [Fusarium solani]